MYLHYIFTSLLFSVISLLYSLSQFFPRYLHTFVLIYPLYHPYILRDGVNSVITAQITPPSPYLQKLKRIKMFDLSSVVKPLPLGKLESFSIAAFKRILNCESKLSINALIGCILVQNNYSLCPCIILQRAHCIGLVLR